MADQIFQVELQDAQLVRAIANALQLMQDPGELMADIGAQLEASAQLRFDTKTDPTGAPWPALSAVTREIYDSDWFVQTKPGFKGADTGSLLERTRQLRASLTFNSGPDWVEIGTSRATKGGRWQVGFLHEFGTTRMPRRGILTADPASGTLGAGDQAAILGLVQGAIDAAFGA